MIGDKRWYEIEEWTDSTPCMEEAGVWTLLHREEKVLKAKELYAALKSEGRDVRLVRMDRVVLLV